ncbi:hypothetical protein CERZMDRAFT_90354 [Cercospora zeae-maydis SCOH1-5]|uniref:Protein YAE1 n=1 Tax=Cercospora zeae-maydis SCOH1-5 TaxID=717836 RepID=A0A6A6FMD7_9PEZI|nr:hypothetical protein CERZMDRAFT_90354 [Cercospora zeae-maydis SCOH1-5]
MLRDTLGRRTSDDAEPALFMTGLPSAGITTRDEQLSASEVAENYTSLEDAAAASQIHTNDLNDDIFGSAPNSPVLSVDHGRSNIDDDDDGGGLSGSGTGTGRAANSSSSSRREQHHSDIPRLRSIHITNGYREGIAVSKESHIQAGFDEGFSLGGEIGQKAGFILGVLEGVARGVRNMKETDELRDEAEKVFGEAKEELRVEKLLGKEWFGGDGIWLYEVEGEEKDDVTFELVAGRHPVVELWMGKMRALCDRVGLNLEVHDEVEELKTR